MTKLNKRFQNEVFKVIYDSAQEAGTAAGVACRPVPMVVQEHSNMLDDNSPVKQEWFVADGPCGFAWVVIRPGTSSFARWLVKNRHAKKHYYGGVSIWVSDYNQSMARKSAHADAMAAYLRKVCINAHAGSNMD